MLIMQIIGILIIGIGFYIGLGYCLPIVVKDGIEEFKAAFDLGNTDNHHKGVKK